MPAAVSAVKISSARLPMMEFSRETREALERAVGEDVAAVLDVFGSHADRNVFQHEFEKLLGGSELPRKLALLAAILMRRDRSAVRQWKEFDVNGLPVRQLGNKALGVARLGIELVDADIEHTALTPQFKELGAGHGRRDVGTREAVNIEVTVVKENNPLPPVGDHDALIEIIQGGADKRVSALFRLLDPPQRGHDRQPDSDQKAADDQATEHRIRDNLRIGRIEIPDKAGFRTRRNGSPDGRNQTHHDSCRNHDPAACLPVLVSHRSPADFCG